MCEKSGVDGFLDLPREYFGQVQKAYEKYTAYKARAYGRGICYENPLGVHIQTSKVNNFEDMMVNVQELEREYIVKALVFKSSILTAWNIMGYVDELTDEQRKVLRRRIIPNRTYKDIAKELNLKNEDTARYLYNTGKEVLESVL